MSPKECRLQDDIPRIHNDLIDKLIHPRITHDKPPLAPGPLAPAILHSPPHRLLLLPLPFHVHRRQHHGMRHRALARHQPLRLRQPQPHIEAQLIIDQRRVHDAGLRAGKLAHVAAEEDGDVGAQRGDAGALHGGHVDVDIAHAAHADNVTQAADAEQLAIVIPRVVDEAEELMHVGAGVCVDGRGAGELLCKIEGRGGEAVEFVFLVVVLPGHFLPGAGRGTQHDGQD